MNDTQLQPNWQAAASTGMGPVLSHEPLASVDSHGQVWPHETGTEIDPQRAYLFTPAALANALNAMNETPSLRVDAAPNLHEGQPEPLRRTAAQLQDERNQSQRAGTAMRMQFADPSGLKIPTP
jgi:hypothetical protein